MTITVLYDNQPCREGLETGWGFSALITGTEKTILFDTGRDYSLLGNMEKLAIESAGIDLVVLSHIHSDHTGGLQSLLEKNPRLTIYLPQSFPDKFKDNAKKSGASIVEIAEAVPICEGVYSTGQVGNRPREQALILRTDKGLVLITGCAHPGIVTMVKAARKLFDDDILLLMGGFHLEWTSRRRIEKTIADFDELGVRHVAPAHCCGRKARGLFQTQFGSNYITIGTGATIDLHDLP
ncbi:MAG: MBL fold metallo-hydrolase [Planctomycetota bacterium]|jgi:7,8-dihydropterin-6-yl-methyl-4-(beta-D-ribofuranosyl)aminobenzene 5'-phosphate synthase